MPTITDDITYQHSALTAALPRYVIVRDCVEQKVKDKTTDYLPQPSLSDTASNNTERYAAYILRAVFYAVTARTLLGMVGQTYARAPEIKLPTIIEIMRNDATGSGLSLQQLSVDTMYNIMVTGRAGLYVDYPVSEGAVTVKQLQDGSVRPTITSYRAEAVTNWRTKKRGSKHVLSLVVLRESVDVENTFSVETVTQYRELRLIDDVYHVRIWREVSENKITAMRQLVDVTPRDSRGFPFNEIPFTFVGAMNNDTDVDETPLYDLAELNIAHYRNSADYEEACFMIGQPTPYFSGLTEDWVTDVLKGEVLLGSRAAVLLPAGAQAGLLQVSANSMPMEAMKHKEAQMVALGARLVENRAVRRTLGEVQQSNASETSILASCANNVSTAYTQALKWATAFVSTPQECVFKLNTDFAMLSMSPEDRMQLIADMQAGALSMTEVRDQLRRVGLATQDDATALVEIAARQEAKAKMEAAAKPAAMPADTPPSNIDNRAK